MTNKHRTTFYVGVTSNLPRRRLEHHDEGSKHFCGKYQIKDVIYVERFDRIIDAIAREKQLKNLHRDTKLDLIRVVNPTFSTLEPPFFNYEPVQNDQQARHADAVSAPPIE